MPATACPISKMSVVFSFCFLACPRVSFPFFLIFRLLRLTQLAHEKEAALKRIRGGKAI